MNARSLVLFGSKSRCHRNFIRVILSRNLLASLLLVSRLHAFIPLGSHSRCLCQQQCCSLSPTLPQFCASPYLFSLSILSPPFLLYVSFIFLCCDISLDITLHWAHSYSPRKFSNFKVFILILSAKFLLQCITYS